MRTRGLKQEPGSHDKQAAVEDSGGREEEEEDEDDEVDDVRDRQQGTQVGKKYSLRKRVRDEPVRIPPSHAFVSAQTHPPYVKRKCGPA
jgi:hypothetical protein